MSNPGLSKVCKLHYKIRYLDGFQELEEEARMRFIVAYKGFILMAH